jgi:TonB family protein
LNRRGERRSASIIPAVALLWAGSSVAAGLPDIDSRVCGRAETVNCAGPGSPAKMQLIVPSGSLLKRSRVLEIVIPAEYRASFGTRIEDAFEQQSVCVADSYLTEPVQTLMIHAPEQLTVPEPRSAPATFAPGAFRTCDAGVQPPTLVSERRPLWTTTPRVDGTVVLQGVVDVAGSVRDVRIVRSLDPSTDADAQKAFTEWQFGPGLLKGELVPVVVTAELTIKHSWH